MREEELPVGWELVNFFDYVDFQEGPGIMAVDFTEYGIPLIRLVNLRRKTVTLEGCNFLSPEKVGSKWSHFKLKNQDILISSSASTGIVSEVTKESEGSIAYTGIIRLRPKNEALDREFLKIFVGSEIFTRQIDALVTGSTIHHYGPSHLKRVTIPLPPLPVQRQIVAVLERAEAVKRQRQEADALTGALLQSVFREMFGDPVRNEKGWEKAKISDITVFHKQGLYTDVNYADDGIRLIRITDISEDGHLNYSSMPFLSINDKLAEQFKVERGDFLFARSGVSIGRCAIVESNIPCVFGSFIIKFQFNPKKIDNKFFLHLIRMPSNQYQLTKFTHGSANPNVNADNIKNLEIFIPPLALQQQFARIVQDVERIREQQGASSRQIEGLCEGLMQRAFAGELGA